MTAIARAALGLRSHSGWATLVVVAGASNAPSVVDRRRIELGDPAVPGPKQPHHEAEGLPIARAGKIVAGYADEARRLARRELGATLAVLEKKGLEVVGCGLLLASGRPLPPLEAILASHALIHTADGELFRDALTDASESIRVPVTKVREREIQDRAAAALRLPTGALQQRIQAFGRSLGPPWRQDEKLATHVAWLVLADWS